MIPKRKKQGVGRRMALSFLGVRRGGKSLGTSVY
jgi:hypothetical protein